jgi:hypothetical protein
MGPQETSGNGKEIISVIDSVKKQVAADRSVSIKVHFLLYLR